MRTHLRKIIGITVAIAAALVLIGFLLYKLPFPSKIDLRLQGAAFTNSGKYISDTDITITGYKLNYLFQPDRMELSFDIGMEPEAINCTKGGGHIHTYLNNGPASASIPYYSARDNKPKFTEFLFNEDFTQFRIDGSSYIYVATTTDEDLSDVFRYFSTGHSNHSSVTYQTAVFTLDGNHIRDTKINLTYYEMLFAQHDDWLELSFQIDRKDGLIKGNGPCRLNDQGFKYTSFEYKDPDGERQTYFFWLKGYDTFCLKTDKCVYIGTYKNTAPSTLYTEFSQFFQ